MTSTGNSTVYKPVGSEFDMARNFSYKRPKNLKKAFLQLMSYIGHHKYMLILVFFLVAVSAVANLIGTYSIKNVVAAGVDDKLEALGLTCGVVAVLYACGVASTFAYSQIMVHLAQSVVYDMRKDLYRKVQDLSLSYFDETPYGDIMSCFTNDVETVSEALNNSFASLIENAITLIGTIVCIFVLSWQLSLIVMAFYVLMFGYLFFASKRSKRYFKLQQEKLGALSGYAEEHIRGMKVVKVFNHEETSLEEFDKASDDLYRTSVKALSYSNSMVPMVMAISYFNYAIVAILGGIFTMKSLIPLENLSSYLVFVRQTSMPINRCTTQSNIILNALASSERIFALIDSSPEVDDGTIVLEKDGDKNYWVGENLKEELKGDVRFEHVTFGYEEGSRVLDDISLYAKPGQKIAFVGSTGAGKTTITNLINRFYDVNEGRITYDGIDVKKIKKASLRSSLGMVLQDTHLFTGTIEENIRFGNLSASFDDVVKAAKLANADSFIRRLPQGYKTILTSDGSNLSQGQRQLLAIARAAVMNPPVLILDEATASVDTYTEKLIEEGMDTLMENRTVFVIAHRLSTVRNADAIIVLEHGKIIERGTHEDLLKLKGRYYELYTGKSELQ